MTAPARRNTPPDAGGAGGRGASGAIWLPDEEAAVLLLLPALALALTPRRDRRLTAAWGAVVMVAGFGFVALRNEADIGHARDPVAGDGGDRLGRGGLFRGADHGRAEVLAAISPKKTWSGTVAGWVGAAGWGLCFVLGRLCGWALVVLSAVIAFAGQMGDIAESWLKRRAGVKDSLA
jgi:phosphatidate cytidylyltransferase